MGEWTAPVIVTSPPCQLVFLLWYPALNIIFIFHLFEAASAMSASNEWKIEDPVNPVNGSRPVCNRK